jgi:predicted HAD superfamily phosphohydrolase
METPLKIPPTSLMSSPVLELHPQRGPNVQHVAKSAAPEPENMIRLNNEESPLDRCEDAEKARRCRGRGGAGAEIRNQAV